MAVSKNCPQMDFTKMPHHKFGGSRIGRESLKVAIQELALGAMEIGGNNRGEWVKKYLNGLSSEGSPWCAGFVSYCFSQTGFAMPFEYALSARQLHYQFNRKNWKYNKSDKVFPEPGDIVFWWRGKKENWQGHVGIVHHSENGFLFTVEGNRTSKVEGFSYKLKGMRRRLGFGRVPDDY